MSQMTETRRRSFIKGIAWRIIATVNSWAILSCFPGVEYSNIQKAVFMNISGFFIYYGFERICNAISLGKKNSL
jgi:hypothetical protein